MLADDPALTVRWSELDEQTQALYPQQNLRQPIRIVIDSQNRVTPVHRIVHGGMGIMIDDIVAGVISAGILYFIGHHWPLGILS